ncbi:hypothetical protein LOK74_18220 [Brevibacillus humidisoli]|uniref:hypothetical protein n=1 Tax=Brevibacillus humidisoli TaxID=2895522 RepID=UPI001E3137CE|nr:hypothetical protein [Brevibacillus humidisoli]UFJ39963.1 hypothetical protein LOK74_18220 [Brevibacillus humidisoli]
MPRDRYYLIYQEASDDECLLTIQPYEDQQALAEALSELKSQQITDYTIIKGRKIKATLRVAVDLAEADDEEAKTDEEAKQEKA